MSDSPRPASPHSSLEDARVEVVPGGPVRGTIRPPGSKSITNRALICAAFADGVSNLSGALRSDDTEVMINALAAVGVDIQVSDGGRSLRVDAAARSKTPPSVSALDLFVANSGTTIRFLTAALSAAGGRYRLHGVPRMHQRPIADLVNALSPIQAGRIETESADGCPPVLIESEGWQGDRIEVAGSVSSQYLSGLMMAAPIGNHQNSINIEVTGELVSRPYVDMTAKVMNAFGAEIELVESAASDATLTVQIGARNINRGLTKSSRTLRRQATFGRQLRSQQAASPSPGCLARQCKAMLVFGRVLQSMGCQVDYAADSITVDGRAQRGVDVDMNAISDTVQTLAAVALFADSPTRVRGVAHNRFKETDRIGDLAKELRKLGAHIEEHDDGLTIHPVQQAALPAPVLLETYHDHRMAMSFSLIGLRLAGVRIKNPSCTAKTYPEFFADLESLLGAPTNGREFKVVCRGDVLLQNMTLLQA